MVPCLVILLFLSATGGRETFHKQGENADSLSSRNIYDRLQLGKLWHVYLPAMTYDLLYSSIHLDRSSSRHTQRSLLDVTSKFPWVIKKRHPCRNGTVVITGARSRGHLYFKLSYSSTQALTSDFRICGYFHLTYIPGYDKELTDQLSHSAEKPLILSWDLMSHGSFLINLTLSGLAAPNSYRCEYARITVTPITGSFWETSNVLCPNRGAMSAIGVRYEVKLFLNYRRGKAVKNNRRNQYFTTVSFQYQILHTINVSAKVFRPKTQRRVLQKEYKFQVDSKWNNDTFLKYSPLVFVGELPEALMYLLFYGLPVISPQLFSEKM